MNRCWIWLAATCCCVFNVIMPMTAAAAARNPNVVLILPDDLGEKHDLAESHPDKVKLLRGQLTP